MESSLYSFEWLEPDGTIKSPEALSAAEQDKRVDVETCIEKGVSMETPILGIGMLDNVEIGSGRATFLTLAAMGRKTMPVHVPTSSVDDFKKYLNKEG